MKANLFSQESQVAAASGINKSVQPTQPRTQPYEYVRACRNGMQDASVKLITRKRGS